MTDRPDLIENLSDDNRVYAAKVAELNDQMRLELLSTRKQMPHQTALFMSTLAQEVQNVEPSIKRSLIQVNILSSIANAGPFTEANDPYGERDFGSFEFSLPGFNEQNERIMWKIDYYDLDQKMHSPDATDPAVTHRVLTIFYASDY